MDGDVLWYSCDFALSFYLPRATDRYQQLGFVKHSSGHNCIRGKNAGRKISSTIDMPLKTKDHVCDQDVIPSKAKHRI